MNGFINCNHTVYSGVLSASTYIYAPYLSLGSPAKWTIAVGTSYTGAINSLIFSHQDTGINSTWWFNGTQTSTQVEISDERIKKKFKILKILLIK